ncbi:MAG: ABC transporter permease [Acidobacteriia bacterium]|nr:ABC transporter permease [Terriglobia bacterium]MBV8905014.1 ABC transporter permease [Terriglobia bacterium]
MRWQRTAAILLRQFYLLRGSPARILPLFAWVGIDIVLWGFLSRYLNAITAARINFVPALLGAVLLWDFFIRIMQGVTTAFLEDVWSRNFLNFFATPLTVNEYVSGLVLSSILTSLVGLAAMLLLATSVFGLSFFIYGATAVPFLFVLFLSGIALGVFATGLVLWQGPAAEWFIWPMPALISPFAAVFYPRATLPPWMQAVSSILPQSYVFENLRAIVAGHAPSAAALLVAIVLAFAYILLAAWFFTGIFRRAVRTGLIARYSAETLN